MAPMVTIAYKGGLGFNNITAGVHHRENFSLKISMTNHITS
jgi:hypothetical protein